MSSQINVLTVDRGPDMDLRFFIDLPIPGCRSMAEQFYNSKPQLSRVEIPQSLAIFIRDLNKENQRLTKQVEKLKGFEKTSEEIVAETAIRCAKIADSAWRTNQAVNNIQKEFNL